MRSTKHKTKTKTNRNAKREARNTKHKTQSTKQKTQNAKRETRKAKRKMVILFPTCYLCLFDVIYKVDVLNSTMSLQLLIKISIARLSKQIDKLDVMLDIGKPYHLVNLRRWAIGNLKIMFAVITENFFSCISFLKGSLSSSASLLRQAISYSSMLMNLFLPERNQFRPF